MAEKPLETVKFTPRQRAFITRWGQVPFPTVAQAAAAVNVSPGLAYNWFSIVDGFRDACNASRDAKQEEIGAEAEAALRTRLMDVVEAKIETALAGTDRERESAQTWVLEHVLGKGAASKSNVDLTTGGQPLDDALASLAGLTMRVALPDDMTSVFDDGD